MDKKITTIFMSMSSRAFLRRRRVSMRILRASFPDLERRVGASGWDERQMRGELVRAFLDGDFACRNAGGARELKEESGVGSLTIWVWPGPSGAAVPARVVVAGLTPSLTRRASKDLADASGYQTLAYGS